MYTRPAVISRWNEGGDSDVLLMPNDEDFFLKVNTFRGSQSLIDPSENVLPERRKLLDDDLFDDVVGSTLSFLIFQNRSRLCWSSQ